MTQSVAVDVDMLSHIITSSSSIFLRYHHRCATATSAAVTA